LRRKEPSEIPLQTARQDAKVLEANPSCRAAEIEKCEAEYPAGIVGRDEDRVSREFDVDQLVEKIWSYNSESWQQGIRSPPPTVGSARHPLSDESAS
jgi:hypothetical protein